MRIEILGTGCSKCRKLTENVTRATQELGLACEIEKVTRIADIVERGVMLTPALVVDGHVESVGRVLDTTALVQLFERCASAAPPASAEQS